MWVKVEDAGGADVTFEDEEMWSTLIGWLEWICSFFFRRGPKRNETEIGKSAVRVVSSPERNGRIDLCKDIVVLLEWE